jgi:hypothetical protein
MALKSILKPDGSLMLGVAELAAVGLIYQSALPSHADIASAPANDATIETRRKAAAWKSAAVIGFVFLLSHDLNSFLLGGLGLAGFDIMVKHANGTNPATGKLQAAPGSAITGSAQAPAAHNSESFPMPDYGDSEQMVSY